jgi:hypothetical protein
VRDAQSHGSSMELVAIADEAEHLGSLRDAHVNNSFLRGVGELNESVEAGPAFGVPDSSVKAPPRMVKVRRWRLC